MAISPQTEVTSLVQTPSGSWGLGLSRPTSGFSKTGCPFVRQHNGEKLSDLLPKSACSSVTHVLSLCSDTTLTSQIHRQISYHKAQSGNRDGLGLIFFWFVMNKPSPSGLCRRHLQRDDAADPMTASKTSACIM